MKKSASSLGMKDTALGGCVAQAVLAPLASEAKPIGRRHLEKIGARKLGEPFRRGIDRQELIRLRIQKEQGIPRFLEERFGQAVGYFAEHRVISVPVARF